MLEKQKANTKKITAGHAMAALIISKSKRLEIPSLELIFSETDIQQKEEPRESEQTDTTS